MTACWPRCLAARRRRAAATSRGCSGEGSSGSEPPPRWRRLAHLEWAAGAAWRVHIATNNNQHDGTLNSRARARNCREMFHAEQNASKPFVTVMQDSARDAPHANMRNTQPRAERGIRRAWALQVCSAVLVCRLLTLPSLGAPVAGGAPCAQLICWIHYRMGACLSFSRLQSRGHRIRSTHYTCICIARHIGYLSCSALHCQRATAAGRGRPLRAPCCGWRLAHLWAGRPAGVCSPAASRGSRAS